MEENEHLETNKTDKRILALLLKNSRLSYRQIAKKLKLAVATVMNHIKKLEKNKIIEQYTTKLNYEKLGYDITVVIQLRISKGKLLEVEKKIATHPNVTNLYDLTGVFDALLVAKFKNRKQMDVFLKKIQTYDFIERTETMLVLNTLKESYADVL